MIELNDHQLFDRIIMLIDDESLSESQSIEMIIELLKFRKK